jgi:type III pantothenate kinase
MKSKTILVIDVGNSSIHCGLFIGSKLKFKDKVRTKKSEAELKKSILALSSKVSKLHLEIEAIIISSVVPSLNFTLKRLLKAKFKARVIFCGIDVVVPVKNLYNNPKQVGQDRLVNAFAGLKLYVLPLIIIDFGTAITFDIVSKQGAYLGGIILPGINLSLNALAQNTALLPKLSLKHKPKTVELIGKTTKQSMFSGATFGFSALATGLIKSLKRELGKNTKVIATGGDIQFIKKYLKESVDIFDENLTLKGLNLIGRSKAYRI